MKKTKVKRQKLKYPWLNSSMAMVILVPALTVMSFHLSKKMDEKRLELEEIQKNVNLQKETLLRERDYLQSKITLFENDDYTLEYAKHKLQRVAANEILISFPDKTEE